MDPAWVAVVGSLGGVAVGGAVTFLIERARWTREDRVRWSEARRALYARLLKALDDENEALNGLADAGDAWAREDDDAVSRATNELFAIRRDLDLIAGAQVLEAAERVFSAKAFRVAWGLGAWPLGSREEVVAQIVAGFEELRVSIETLKQAARAELGVEDK